MTPRLLPALLVLAAACNHEPPLPGTERDRLVMVLDDPPRNLDPRFSTDAASMRVSRLVFSSLVSLDNATLAVAPDLAERWAPDPKDPASWLVHLRPDARWHDGTPVTSADVVYTYRSVMDPALQSPFREPYQAHIAAVEAEGPLTVRFRLVEPYATFETDLVLGIVPEHVCAPAGGRFPPDGYVGSGPYRFAGRWGERRLDLEAFDGYFGGAPGTRWLVLRTIREEGSRLLAVLGGSADLMQNGVSPVLGGVVEHDPRLVATHAPSISFTYVALNLRQPALADRRVRQALAWAIPREHIVETHYGGAATLATGMLAPMHWAYEKDVPTYGYDPAKARALLAEAGYGPGKQPLALTIKISTHRFRRTVARAIAQAWREVGVDARVRSYEFATFFADIRQGTFDAYLLDLPEPMEPDLYRWMLHGLSTPDKAPARSGSAYALADRRFLSPGALDEEVAADPTCATWPWLATRDAARNWVSRAFGVEPPYAAANRMAYANPAVDCRLDLGLRVLTRKERLPLYHEVQRLLAVDLPVIPLWHEDVRIVARTRVRDFVPLPNLRLGGLVRAKVGP